MLNQTFSPTSLLKNTILRDVIKYKLGRDKKAILEELTKISYTITDEDFIFKNITKVTVANTSLYMANDVSEYYALKQVNYVLRKIYKIKFSNKSLITNQICKILSDKYKYEIIRLDIKKFFESIDRNKIINKIINDSFLSSQMINKIDQFNKFLNKDGLTGLPRGISLSSTLSEIYIRKLDNILKSDSNVYFYARYVDDIIVICNKDSDKIKTKILFELSELNLETNNKSKFISMNSNKNSEISYLGIKYTFQNNSDRILIGISDKKSNKIKSRIIKSILDCCKTKNYKLLEMRITFLTSNHFLHKDGVVSKLKSGIYYSNQNVNDFRCFNDLNSFLRSSITSKKGSFGKKVSTIPIVVKDEILKKCFFSGFINKTMHLYKYDDFLKIKECWKNE